MSTLSQVDSSSPDSGAGAGPSKNTPKRRPGGQSQGACEGCRRRKARCDGRRPTCGACAQTRIECIWETRVGESRTAARARHVRGLRQENNDLRQENDILRRQLDDQSVSLPGSNESDASTMVHQEVPTLHPFDQTVLRSWPSSTEYRLLLLHPNSYAFQSLPDYKTLQAVHAKHVRHVLGDVAQAAVPASLRSFDITQSLLNPPELRRYSDQISHGELSVQQHATREAANYPDHRLRNISVHNWCEVPIPDDLAGRLLSFYLEMDHPVLGHFDSDLFVEDLVAGKNEFCSSFLVVSLLLWACVSRPKSDTFVTLLKILVQHGYSNIDRRAAILKPTLYAESRRLWQQERETDSVLSAAGGILLHCTCVCNHEERLGREILEEVYAMAHRLGLFGHAPHPLEHGVTKKLRSSAHVAWGIFNFITLHAFSNGKPIMRHPPMFVVPGDDYTWHLPEYMGHTFTKSCKLFAIMAEVALSFFSENPGSIASRTSLEFTEGIYIRLLDWAKTNGPLIENWTSDAHHQSYLNIIFHSAILDIFRPFLLMDLPLQTPGWQEFTIRHIFEASVHQLYFQLSMYPIVHPSATFMFWWIGIVQCANAAMITLQDDDSQQIFLQCLIALHGLTPCFPAMSTAVAGLLQVVTRKDYMNAQSVRHVYERLRPAQRTVRQPNEVPAGFALDLSPELRGSDLAMAGTLADVFEKTMLGEGFA